MLSVTALIPVLNEPHPDVDNLYKRLFAGLEKIVAELGSTLPAVRSETDGNVHLFLVPLAHKSDTVKVTVELVTGEIRSYLPLTNLVGSVAGLFCAECVELAPRIDASLVRIDPSLNAWVIMEKVPPHEFLPHAEVERMGGA